MLFILTPEDSSNIVSYQPAIQPSRHKPVSYPDNQQLLIVVTFKSALTAPQISQIDHLTATGRVTALGKVVRSQVSNTICTVFPQQAYSTGGALDVTVVVMTKH